LIKKIPLDKVVLSVHAVERLTERRISIAELESILTEPDTVVTQGPKLIFQKNFKKRKDNDVAAVVLERREKNLWLVITVLVNFQKK